LAAEIWLGVMVKVPWEVGMLEAMGMLTPGLMALLTRTMLTEVGSVLTEVQVTGKDWEMGTRAFCAGEVMVMAMAEAAKARTDARENFMFARCTGSCFACACVCVCVW